jgi:5-hydroxyisourate hydrolase
MRVELWRLSEAGGRELLTSVRTNGDGRTDAPLLAEGGLHVGSYELIFWVGEYFAAQGIAGPSPIFLDRVPVRFGIADPSAHYHIPLLTSPWAYSTYRGS